MPPRKKPQGKPKKREVSRSDYFNKVEYRPMPFIGNADKEKKRYQRLWKYKRNMLGSSVPISDKIRKKGINPNHRKYEDEWSNAHYRRIESGNPEIEKEFEEKWKGIKTTNPIHDLVEKKELEREKEFEKKAEDYKKRFHKNIKPRKKQIEIAEKKWKELMSNPEKFFRMGGMQKILQELGRGDSFQKKEVAAAKRSIFQGHGDPTDIVDMFRRSFAHQVTEWGELAKYEAMAYFKKEAFKKSKFGRFPYKWGRIQKIPTGEDPVLAVQVMHWEPKVLYSFTKAMLKKRPNNPVAIIDIYGNRFFP